jgi:hypothetical protein
MAIESFDVVAKSSLGGSQPVPGSPPTFLQVQSNGTNLGGADVSKLNFSTGTTATRGTGENADTVTVTAEGEGGSGVDTLLLRLQAQTQGDFNGTLFSNWTASAQVTSADASWVTNHIAFTRTGMYAVTIVARVNTDGGQWEVTGETLYGTEVNLAQVLNRSLHSRKAEFESVYAGPPEVVWTDKYWMNVTDLDAHIVTPKVYASRYQNNFDPANMSALVEVVRIGPPLFES